MDTKSSVLRLPFVFSALASLAASAPIWSQASEDGLEEVTVTAERRAVSVQDIPVSAIVLSGNALEERGVKTFEELQYQVPSLVFTDNGNGKFVNIRGVGVSESAPNQTVGVAVHLDGAYVAREFVFGDAFFDLDGVEVLRGPQGTYSGQNAAGGAIFINSRKPSIGSADGFFNVELGDNGLRRFGGATNFSLSDSLAVRVGADVETRDSFYDNHGVDPRSASNRIEDQPGNLDRWLGRVQVLYAPSDALEMRLIHELSDVRTDGVPYKNFPVRGTNDLPATGLRELYYDMDGHRNVNYDRTTAKLDWQAHEAFKVLATASYLGSHQHYLQDGDRDTFITPTTLQNGADYTINDHYWSAELNLLSTGTGPLDWTVGATYLDYEQDNFLNFLRYNNAQFPGTAVDLQRHTRLYFFLNNVRTNRAVFGEVGYQFTPTLQLKVGLRYNEDEVGFSPESYQSGGPVYPAGRLSHYNAPSGPPLPAGLNDFDATTGRVLLNWKPSEDQLIYATVSRGYKPGGTTPLADTYDSEEVTNYELGWKGDALDGAITASVSAFYMEYENFQRTYAPDPNNPATAVTNNVDGSTIKGLEAQLGGQLGGLRWDVSFAYNDGTYGDLNVVLPVGIQNGVLPTAPGVLNIRGQSIDYLPKKVWNAGVSWQGLMVGGGRLIPSVRVSHQDSYYTTFYQYDYNLTPGKTLLDVSLAYEADANWRIEAYARNAADKDYISRAQGGSDARGFYLLGNPRQIGLKLGYQF
jgi:iron complex outermembrane recepter protein